MGTTLEVNLQSAVGARFTSGPQPLSWNSARGLTPEDMMVQSSPDTSPVKWHLAHTAWFFESFILREFLPGYRIFNPDFPWLFNSYYEGFSAFPEKKLRASFSRPAVEEILRYREHVDRGIDTLLESNAHPEAIRRIELGAPTMKSSTRNCCSPTSSTPSSPILCAPCTSRARFSQQARAQPRPLSPSSRMKADSSKRDIQATASASTMSFRAIACGLNRSSLPTVLLRVANSQPSWPTADTLGPNSGSLPAGIGSKKTRVALRSIGRATTAPRARAIRDLIASLPYAANSLSNN